MTYDDIDNMKQEIADQRDQIEYLNKQIEELLFCIKLHEVELKKYLSEEEFVSFSIDAAQKLFERSVLDMEDGGFKDFCMDMIDRWKP